MLCDHLEVGGRLMRKGKYVYTQLIHFVVQQKLTHIVKQFHSNFKKPKQTMTTPPQKTHQFLVFYLKEATYELE